MRIKKLDDYDMRIRKEIDEIFLPENLDERQVLEHGRKGRVEKRPTPREIITQF